jgi:predicted transcriptional regulator
MRVLWTVPQATVRTVRSALPGRPRIAYNTVLTTLRILEHKGYVAHRQAGRAFIFRARITLDATRRRAIRYLIARLFENSPAVFVQRLIGDAYLSRAAVEQAMRQPAVPRVR